MRRFIPLVILLLIASASLGWFRAGTIAGPRAAEVDGWDALQHGQPSDADYKAMAAKFKQSALLPLTTRLEIENAANAAALQTAAGPLAAPPFPQIVGSSRINNARVIHVILADNTLTKLRQGEVLESGWEIKTVDRKRVIAVFDGEELEIPIIAYLEAAFEKSEEDGMNEGADVTSGGE